MGGGWGEEQRKGAVWGRERVLKVRKMSNEMMRYVFNIIKGIVFYT